MGALDLDGADFINPKWKVCFYDAEDALLDVATGIRDLTSFNMEGVTKFVYSMGAAFWALDDALKDCTWFIDLEKKKQEERVTMYVLAGEKEDPTKYTLQTVESIAAILQFPNNFEAVVGKSVKVNGVELFDDLEKAHEEYELKNWGNVGYYVGDAARHVISSKESYE